MLRFIENLCRGPKHSDWFYQGPGTQKLIECRWRSLYPTLKITHLPRLAVSAWLPDWLTRLPLKLRQTSCLVPHSYVKGQPRMSCPRTHLRFRFY